MGTCDVAKANNIKYIERLPKAEQQLLFQETNLDQSACEFVNAHIRDTIVEPRKGPLHKHKRPTALKETLWRQWTNKWLIPRISQVRHKTMSKRVAAKGTIKRLAKVDWARIPQQTRLLIFSKIEQYFVADPNMSPKIQLQLAQLMTLIVKDIDGKRLTSILAKNHSDGNPYKLLLDMAASNKPMRQGAALLILTAAIVPSDEGRKVRSEIQGLMAEEKLKTPAVHELATELLAKIEDKFLDPKESIDRFMGRLTKAMAKATAGEPNAFSDLADTAINTPWHMRSTTMRLALFGKLRSIVVDSKHSIVQRMHVARIAAKMMAGLRTSLLSDDMSIDPYVVMLKSDSQFEQTVGITMLEASLEKDPFLPRTKKRYAVPMSATRQQGIAALQQFITDKDPKGQVFFQAVMALAKVGRVENSPRRAAIQSFLLSRLPEADTTQKSVVISALALMDQVNIGPTYTTILNRRGNLVGRGDKVSGSLWSEKTLQTVLLQKPVAGDDGSAAQALVNAQVFYVREALSHPMKMRGSSAFRFQMLLEVGMKNPSITIPMIAGFVVRFTGDPRLPTIFRAHQVAGALKFLSCVENPNNKQDLRCQAKYGTYMAKLEQAKAAGVDVSVSTKRLDAMKRMTIQSLHNGVMQLVMDLPTAPGVYEIVSHAVRALPFTEGAKGVEELLLSLSQSFRHRMAMPDAPRRGVKIDRSGDLSEIAVGMLTKRLIRMVTKRKTTDRGLIRSRVTDKTVADAVKWLEGTVNGIDGDLVPVVTVIEAFCTQLLAQAKKTGPNWVLTPEFIKHFDIDVEAWERNTPDSSVELSPKMIARIKAVLTTVKGL